MDGIGRAPEEGYAERFRLLRDTFLRVDGESWRPVEIRRETGGRISQSYLSALAGGQIARPGLDKLGAIADAMGFPLSLWWVPPPRWEGELKRAPATGARTQALSLAEVALSDPYEGILLPRPPAGGELANLVEALFDRHPDPRTAKTRHEAEVAAATRGRLSGERVRLMRNGGLREAPRWDELIALAEVFGLSVGRWFAEGGRTLGISVEGLIRKLESEPTRALFCGRRLSAEEGRALAGMMRLARGDPPDVARRAADEGGEVLGGRVGVGTPKGQTPEGEAEGAATDGDPGIGRSPGPVRGREAS